MERYRLRRLTDYQDYLDTQAQTAYEFQSNVSLCEASYSSEHAYGFSNFGSAPVHKFCKNTEKTSFNGLITFKCYNASYGNLCEIAINKDRYPTIESAEFINIEIEGIKSILKFHAELPLSTEGENHIIRRYWLEGSSTDLFNFIKSNVGNSYNVLINWN